MTTEDVFQAVENLQVSPGDIVVLRMAVGHHCEMARDAAWALADSLPEGATLMYLAPNHDIGVVRSDLVKALQAWQEAWQTQGDARIHAMVHAATRTEIALKHLEESPCPPQT